MDGVRAKGTPRRGCKPQAVHALRAAWTSLARWARRFDLNAASMSDVQEWFKTYYGPSNAVLCVAGDIDAEAARQKVEKYFGDIPAGPPLATNRVWWLRIAFRRRESLQGLERSAVRLSGRRLPGPARLSALAGQELPSL